MKKRKPRMPNPPLKPSVLMIDFSKVRIQKRFIFEVPVYCGRLKEWRVLNLNTGTVYSGSHATMNDAIASIREGEDRGGLIVKAATLPQICQLLESRCAIG